MRYCRFSTLAALLLLSPAIGQSVSAQTATVPPAAAVFNGDRNVMVVTEIEADTPADVWRRLYRRMESIADKQGSTGVTRYWMSDFAGTKHGRLIVTDEYPSLLDMANAKDRIERSPEFARWSDDARRSGLKVHARYVMSSRDEGDRAVMEQPAMPAGASPHVLQFLVIDISANPAAFMESYPRATIMNAKYGSTGQSRLWRTSWSGEQVSQMIATVEFPSLPSMIESIVKVDSTPEFAAFAAERAKLGIKRSSEVIAREVRP